MKANRTPATEGFDATELGAMMREMRENLGHELADVAADLRIRLVYLEAIEAGKLTDLPGSAYVSGFLRSYSDYLGLDGEEIVRRFREAGVDLAGQTQLHLPSPVEEGRLPTGPILLLAALVAGAAYGGWYYFSAAGQGPIETVAKLPADLASLVERGSPETSPASAPEVSSTRPGDADASAATENAVPAPTREPAEAPAAETGAVEPEAVTPTVTPPSAASSTAPEPTPMETPVARPAEPSTPTADSSPDPAPAAQAGQQTGTSREGELTDSAGAAETAPAEASETGSVAQVSPPVSSPAAPSQSSGSSPETLTPQAADVRADLSPTSPEASPAAPPVEVTPQTAASAPVSDAASVPEPPPVAPVAEPAPAVAPQTAAVPTASASDTGPEAETTAAPRPAPDVTEVAARPDADQSAPSSVAPSSAAESVASTVPSEPVSAATRIVVRATADSFVAVLTSDKQILFSQLMRPGDSYEVPSGADLILETGNAGGLEILVGGRKVPSLGPTGLIRRNIPLNARELLAGVN